MAHEVYMAIRYLLFHRWKTLIMVTCITLTAFLPILMAIWLWQFDQRIAARASATPLIVGAKGSGVDLTLHLLYFSTPPADTIAFGECRAIRETALARAIPIYARFQARKNPVVGTSLDYFDFRQLEIEAGRKFATLGECVLGSEVAASLQLNPGDRLITDRENLVDIAGLFPLRLHVVGVLKPTRTADDRAVFVDVKTSWVIAGLGHGHEDLQDVTDQGKVEPRASDSDPIVARASVLPFLEITPDNAHSVHFHGDVETFPLTGILAVAPDEKSETLLIGRFQNPEAGTQILVPRNVIEDLMGLVFQISQIFHASLGLVGVATACLFALVVSLSLRLREREMLTMFRMGCSRWTIFRLQAAELLLVFTLSTILLAGLIFAAYRFGEQILEQLIVS